MKQIKIENSFKIIIMIMICSYEYHQHDDDNDDDGNMIILIKQLSTKVCNRC